MAHKYNSDQNAFLVLDDSGYMQLYTREGSLVAPNIFLRVTDHVDNPSEVIGKFIVNIVGTKEEMLSEIERYKKG